MQETIEWRQLERQQMPGVLLGMEEASRKAARKEPSEIDNAGLLFGFRVTERGGERLAIVLTRERLAGENFAWLSSFSSDSFPLSQYVRVISETDWPIVSNQGGDALRGVLFQNAPLVSVIVGEVFAQSDLKSIELLPGSRASAAFSFALARCVGLYGPHSPAVRLTAERLRTLENRDHFAGRSISVEDLLAPWAMATIDRTHFSAESSVPIDVMRTFESSGPENSSALSHQVLSLIAEEGSAERRVRGFELVSKRAIALLEREGPSREYAVVSIAAAAFAAGRGTSHIDLLRPFRSRHPSVYVWFGLMAGLAGPASWTTAWLRTVKSMERHVRTGFSLEDPPSSDLCWPEYMWLTTTFGKAALEEVYKATPKALTLEIFPGATCQLRLSSDGAQVAEVAPATVKGAPAKVERPTFSEATLAEAQVAISRLQALINELKGKQTSGLHAESYRPEAPEAEREPVLPLFEEPGQANRSVPAKPAKKAARKRPR